jgi:prepilin-type processing-associated H-X9-DG protein
MLMDEVRIGTTWADVTPVFVPIRSHNHRLNYLFFDGHVEALELPPHPLHTSPSSGFFEDGTDWRKPFVSNGYAGFKAKFNYHEDVTIRTAKPTELVDFS